MDEAKILLSNILSLGDWPTWKNCIDQVEDCIKTWESKIIDIHFRRVYLVGCGSSYYAGQVGKYIIEQIVHLPAEAKQAFSFTHYFDSSLFTRDTLVTGLSTTGNTAATSDALSLAQQNSPANYCESVRDEFIKQHNQFLIFHNFKSWAITSRLRPHSRLQAITSSIFSGCYALGGWRL